MMVSVVPLLESIGRKFISADAFFVLGLLLYVADFLVIIIK